MLYLVWDLILHLVLDLVLLQAAPSSLLGPGTREIACEVGSLLWQARSRHRTALGQVGCQSASRCAALRPPSTRDGSRDSCRDHSTVFQPSPRTTSHFSSSLSSFASLGPPSTRDESRGSCRDHSTGFSPSPRITFGPHRRGMGAMNREGIVEP